VSASGWRGQRPQDRAVICLCGIVAEHKATGRPLAAVAHYNSKDMKMAADALMRLPLPRPSLADAFRQAQQLVDRHWGQITALAGVLRERQRLTYDQVLAALHQPPPMPMWRVD
jgi:hypothetical protein